MSLLLCVPRSLVLSRSLSTHTGADMGNIAAPAPAKPLVPWTWDEVIYQTPGEV